MASDAIVVGGGVGGIVAALRLAQKGASVHLFEARDQLGGLASSVTYDDQKFDGGPYILLDRQRLRWAFEKLEIDFDEISFHEMDPAFTINTETNQFSIFSSLEKSCHELNQIEPGSGDTYKIYARHATKALKRLAPLLVQPHSRRKFLTSGAWRSTFWVLLSLERQIKRFKLTGPAEQAVTIWTQIAGGEVAKAPGPMAMVPALIHNDGAARPAKGIFEILELLEKKLRQAGVIIHTSSPVKTINHTNNKVSGITLEDGSVHTSKTVVCDVGASAALLDLAGIAPTKKLKRRLFGPLQSPGIAAYLTLKGKSASEINFRLSTGSDSAVSFIHNGNTNQQGQSLGRIISPLSNEDAQKLGASGQTELLEKILSDSWWQQNIDSFQVAGTRLVKDWGREFRLKDDAMNLVMARKQMIQGRLPHTIDQLPGLFLAGSWTHPGQWISFCSVSGILAADEALRYCSE